MNMNDIFSIIIDSFKLAYYISNKKGYTFSTHMTITDYDDSKHEFTIKLSIEKEYVMHSAEFRFRYVDSCIYIERDYVNTLWFEAFEQDVIEIVDNIAELYSLQYDLK